MLDDHYTIKVANGKYTVINHRNRLEFLRYDEFWPGAADMTHNNVIYAMAQRIEELEMAIGQVLDGSIIAGPRVRADDGMKDFHGTVADTELIPAWEERLRKVLEQKP